MEQDYDQEALEDSSSLEVSESVPEDLPQARDHEHGAGMKIQTPNCFQFPLHCCSEGIYDLQHVE